MTVAWHSSAARVLLAAVLSVACICAATGEAMAQQPAEPSKKTPKSRPPAEQAAQPSGKADLVTAQRFVETGVTHLEAGRLDAAVSSLTSALSAGSLPAAQTARALHYRGVAHRRQGKPAQALSDLTSALSVRNGLNDAQRAEALRERAAAYRDAGLPDQSEADSVRAAKAPAAPAAPVATAATARAGAEAAPAAPSGGGGGLFGSWFGGGGGATSAAPAPKAAPAPAPAAALQSTTAWSRNVEVRAASPEPAPKAASTEVKTAAVARPAPAPAAPPAREPKAKPAKAEPAPSGTLRVQVALVRSRDEAERLAGQIQQKHARTLAGRQATIDEVVMGNMGTFYRLRVGPFADAAASRALCASLKGDGLHCSNATP